MFICVLFYIPLQRIPAPLCLEKMPFWVATSPPVKPLPGVSFSYLHPLSSPSAAAVVEDSSQTAETLRTNSPTGKQRWVENI